MQKAPTALGCLPQELLFHIFDFLVIDHDRASSMLLRKEPSEEDFRRSTDHGPIKSLATVCRSIRKLLLPDLFRHLKLEVERADPWSLASIVKVLRDNTLLHHVESVLVIVRCDASILLIQKQLNQLFKETAPRQLTIVAPPEQLGRFVGVEIPTRDLWIFDIPYQVLDLAIEKDKRTFPSSARGHAKKGINRSPARLPLELRRWSRCRYNMGSFVRAYGTYEYHNLTGPNIFVLPSEIPIPVPLSLLPSLRSFILVAVFPYNQMAKTCSFLDLLPSLESLSIQLAPSAECHNDRSCATASSSASASDFWSELTDNYLTLALSLRHWENEAMSECTVVDYSDPGYRETVDKAMSLAGERWKATGDGRWLRDRKLMTN